MWFALVGMDSKLANEESRLRCWRRENGYSLQETAALTGYSVPMMSRVERGERNLSPRAKVQVARRLGAPIGDLFDIEPVPEDGEMADV